MTKETKKYRSNNIVTHWNQIFLLKSLINSQYKL